MSSHAGRLEKIERELRHAQGTRSTPADSWLNGYQEDVAWLLAENQRLEEQRDTALRKIADWQAIAESSKSENQRLREALKLIQALPGAEGSGAAHFAREALAGDAE